MQKRIKGKTIGRNESGPVGAVVGLGSSQCGANVPDTRSWCSTSLKSEQLELTVAPGGRRRHRDYKSDSNLIK